MSGPFAKTRKASHEPSNPSIGNPTYGYHLCERDKQPADSYSGYIARAYASHISGSSISGEDWYRISLDLMDKDFQARQAKVAINNDPAVLAWSDILQYHALTFAKFNLPVEAWTAYTPLATSSNPAATWAAMLDVDNGGFGTFFYNSVSLLGATGSQIVQNEFDSFVSTNPTKAQFESYFQVNGASQTWGGWAWGGMQAFGSWLIHASGNQGAGDVIPFSFTEGGITFIGGSSINGDTLFGTGTNDRINGYAGDDVIFAGAGDDWVYGGAGADIIIGQQGNDFLDGDFGNGTDDGKKDTVAYIDSTGAVLVDFWAGSTEDKTAGIVNVLNDGFDTSDIVMHFEDFMLSEASDVVKVDLWHGLFQKQITMSAEGDTPGTYGDKIDFSGNNSADLYVVTSGGSVLARNLTATGFEHVIGSDRGDNLTIGGSLRILDGGKGGDVISGNVEGTSGPVYLIGGEGDDVIRATANVEKMFAGVVKYDSPSGIVADGSIFAGNDILEFGNSSAGITAYLSSSTTTSATLSGGAAAGDEAYGFNHVSGSGYNDIIYGNAEMNTLRGLGGNDTIYAGSGTGTGNHLWGDGGSDLFVFDLLGSPQQNSTIYDFVLLEDHVRVQGFAITGTWFENTYSNDNGGTFVLPGQATISFGSTTVNLNITSIASGYEQYDILGMSIFG